MQEPLNSGTLGGRWRSGSTKLVRHRAGVCLYARVKVAATEGDPAVLVEDDVFAWVKEAYGPNAFAYRDSDDFRGAAKLGAEYALRNLTTVSRPRTTSGCAR